MKCAEIKIKKRKERLVKVKKILGLVLSLAMLMTIVGCTEKKETLKVFNWGEYIAEGVIDEFEEEFNCRVIYEEFDSNEAMMAKVQNSGSSSYDVVFPSDYTVSKMIGLDMLHKLNYENIPNAANLNEAYIGLSYDPEGAYSVPYMMNTLGILYNKTMVSEEVSSIGILFDEKYSGNVLMLDGMRDTLGMTLKYLGYSMNTKNPEEINEAKELLIAQKPGVLAYVGDEVRDKMVNGEAALALVFSGEGNKALAESSDLRMTAVPLEGSNLAIDTMVILKESKHIELAEAFVNFMLRPDIALRNAEETGYTSPNKAAVELLDPSIANDKNYYPSEEDLAKCEIFLELPAEAEKLWSDAWTKLLAS